MLSILAIFFVAGTVAEFEAAGTATPLAGTLAQLDPQRIVLQTAAGPREVPLGATELVARPAPTAAARPQLWVELTDGSLLAGQSYQSSGKEARIGRGESGELKLPLGSVASVHFSAGEATSGWRAGHGRSGDLLAVRKGEETEFLAGGVGDVTAEAVTFELDGETIAVKRRKVVGIVYREPPGAVEWPESFCTLVAADGSTIAAAQVKLRDNVAQVVSPAGVEVQVPLSEVARVKLAKVTALANLEPESATRTPFLGGEQALSRSARTFFSPRLKNPAPGRELLLFGKSYSEGLSLVSRTELVYRLPAKCRALRALAGIDDSVRPQGDVRLRIFGDERPLVDARLTGRDTKPLPLDIDLRGVNRLKIVVDFNGDEVADVLDLCEARIFE